MNARQTSLVAVTSRRPAHIALEKLREPYLARYPENPNDVLERVRCPPGQIFNMLAHLEEQYGGVVGYLRTIGLSEPELMQLEERLLRGNNHDYRK
jgi:hypothetical protein